MCSNNHLFSFNELSEMNSLMTRHNFIHHHSTAYAFRAFIICVLQLQYLKEINSHTFTKLFSCNNIPSLIRTNCCYLYLSEHSTIFCKPINPFVTLLFAYLLFTRRDFIQMNEVSYLSKDQQSLWISWVEIQEQEWF